MPKLYRYFSKQEHLDAFLQKGEVHFSSLSFFRSHKDANIRGDVFEGTRFWNPKGGLEITNHTRNQKFTLDAGVTSSVDGGGIFIFCTSTILSKSIADKFSAVGCVEIFMPDIFVKKLNDALHLVPKFKRKSILHGLVKSYTPQDELGGIWPFPDEIIFYKFASYADQNEYRFAFGYNEALKPSNTVMTITTDHKPLLPEIFISQTLRLKDVSDCCKEVIIPSL